jgi:type IV pilus assembly protein PilA
MYSQSLPSTPTARDRLDGAWERLCRSAHDQRGFTLVELLVVCLVIGVLAAVAIPSFFGQQGKAVDVQAKSLARTAQTAAEALATENSGSYEKVSRAELNRDEPAIPIVASTGGAYLSGATGANDEYTVTARATNGDEYSIRRNAFGDVTRTCFSPLRKSGCSGAESGAW